MWIRYKGFTSRKGLARSFALEFLFEIEFLMASPDPDRNSFLSRHDLSPGRLFVLLAAYLLVFALVGIEVFVARRAIMIEVRNAARDLAALLSYEVSADTINKIYLPDDMDRPEFQQMLAFFRKVRETYHDVRYVYIIRPVPDFDSEHWLYVIDEQAQDRDVDRNGMIDPDEKGVVPSMKYVLNPGAAASLRSSISGPVATENFYDDDNGRFLSGFAPVIDPLSERPMAVVGVDISQAAVTRKYGVLYLVSALSLVLMLTFVSFVFSALFSKERSLRMIKLLSNRVGEQNEALQLSNAQLGQTVTELSQREAIMSEELSLAQQIQQRFLPDEYPMSGRLRFASHYDPCSKIGGDLYDAFFIDDLTAGFFVADVSGHGVSAALLTAALKVAIDRYRLAIGHELQAARALSNGKSRTRREQALAQLLHELNVAMRQIALPSQFVTILIGVIDIDSGEVLLGNAGHNPPIVWRAANASVEIPVLPSNIAIGLLDDFDFEISSIIAQPGDKLIVFTDGIFERRNGEDEEYGMERLLTVARVSAGENIDTMVTTITNSLNAFAGECEAHDDQAILIVEFLP